MTARAHRLAILTSEEIDDLYGLPNFTDEDRSSYCDLGAVEQAAVDERHGKIGVHLVLQLGYFKAIRAAILDDSKTFAGKREILCVVGFVLHRLQAAMDGVGNYVALPDSR